jgi:hypothetical protein
MSALDMSAILIAAISQSHHEEYERRETHIIIFKCPRFRFLHIVSVSVVSKKCYYAVSSVVVSDRRTMKQNNQEEWAGGFKRKLS